MEIIKDRLNYSIYIPNMLKSELSNKNICFLDIETTGLSSKYNEVILIGLLCIENDKVYITQFFADSISEEYELLSKFEEFINKFSYIITYNGNTFDLPFLKKRLDFHKINNNIDDFLHLDLLRLVRKNKNLLKLDNCKLKTVERYLNIYREDTISGKESVDLYKDYEYSKDQHKKNIILKHNYDDILYLPQLLSIYDIVEKETILNMNLDFKESIIKTRISKDDLVFKDNTLSIVGKSEKARFPTQVYFKDNYTLSWDIINGDFTIDIKYNTAYLSSKEKCFYIDMSDFNISLNNFNIINSNIPKNLLLLKVDDSIIYENIISLVSKIISTIK